MMSDRKLLVIIIAGVALTIILVVETADGTASVGDFAVAGAFTTGAVLAYALLKDNRGDDDD